MRVICGIAINDADYSIRTGGGDDKNGRCPYYDTWYSMVHRCHGTKVARPYLNVRVCSEWLTFSKFKAWMETQDWKGKVLDKDLLSVDESEVVYSPNTCIFISGRLNSFIADATNNGLPKGVYWDKNRNKYTVVANNPNLGKKTVNLGRYVCKWEAHRVLKSYKLGLAKDLVGKEELKGNVAIKLLKRYI